MEDQVEMITKLVPPGSKSKKNEIVPVGRNPLSPKAEDN